MRLVQPISQTEIGRCDICLRSGVAHHRLSFACRRPSKCPVCRATSKNAWSGFILLALCGKVSQHARRVGHVIYVVAVAWSLRIASVATDMRPWPFMEKSSLLLDQVKKRHMSNPPSWLGEYAGPGETCKNNMGKCPHADSTTQQVVAMFQHTRGGLFHAV